jgi:hypothetical protein
MPELGALLLRERQRLAVAGLGRRGIAHCQEHVTAQPQRLGPIPSILRFLRQLCRRELHWRH